MIFPNIRLSDLEQDAHQKKEAYQASYRQFKSTLQNKVKPFSILKDHPKIVITTILSILSMSKLLGRTVSAVVTPLKKKGFSRLLRMGWSLQLARLAGKWSLKYFLPMAVGTLKSAMRNGKNRF